MTIENRRWSPLPPQVLNVAAKSYEPQDVADSLLDRVYSPLAANIWGDRPSTSLPTSNRTHSRFSHTSDDDRQGEEEETGDAEVVAMLKLSTNLHSLTTIRDEDDTESEMGHSRLSLRPPSPRSTSIFSADLERVNTWFKEELQDDTQRLMVVFSLIQLMPEWQQDFLMQLLEQQKKSRKTRRESVDNKSMISRPPPGLDSKPASPIKQMVSVASTIVKPVSAPPRVPSGPLSWRRSTGQTSLVIEETTPVILASPTPRRASLLIHQDMNDVFPGHHHHHHHQHQQHITISQHRSLPLTPSQQDDTYSALFWTDLHAWLRCLRLHKYEYIFQRVDRRTFLNWSTTDLENAGVVAMGARNKFLRLFELIRDQQRFE